MLREALVAIDFLDGPQSRIAFHDSVVDCMYITLHGCRKRGGGVGGGGGGGGGGAKGAPRNSTRSLIYINHTNHDYFCDIMNIESSKIRLSEVRQLP